jgi:two-component system, chemotaxis family, sensor kinase CheA
MDPMALLKQSFLEECDELLSALERCLQDMDNGAADGETVNAAFRAIHSIKGGAGAFGFTQIVPYAHSFEAALDLLRNGKVRVADAPLALFLRTADAVGACVAAARNEQPAPQFPDLIEGLKQFVASGGVAGAASSPAEPPSAATSVPGPVVVSPSVAEAAGGYHIRITPHDNLFRRLVEPPQILQSLEALGEPVLTCDVSAVPRLTELDPALCNLRFDILLDSAATREQLEDVLERCFDADELAITSRGGSDTAGAAQPSAAATGRLADAATGGPETNAGAAFPLAGLNAEALPGAPLRSAIDDNALAAARQLPLMSPLPDASGVVPTLKNRPAMVRTIRVDLDRVDRLMNLVGEIVITQSMLIDRSRNLPVLHALQLTEGIEALTRQTRELQDQVMAVRAQPVKTVFQRMPRVVRDLATTLGKEVRLVTHGEDTEVDKTIIEELADPLTHMIRNALDHGLEKPEDRIAAGKPVEGVVTLSAEQRGGRIVITIEDDGRGLPRDKLFAKAVARGVMAADAKPSSTEIDALIFHAGLSTAEAVTDVSGRGVGMDVVKQNVEALGGRVTVESEPGKGCSFALSLPLTLAVADGMVVKVAGQRIIVPISSIMETLQISNCKPDVLPGGGEIVRLRGEVAPLIRLASLLELGEGGQETVVISAETDRGEIIGVAVDEILGQQQVVVKSLEASFGAVAGASAATILGDGMVALILDIDALPGLVARRSAKARASHAVPLPTAA